MPLTLSFRIYEMETDWMKRDMKCLTQCLTQSGSSRLHGLFLSLPRTASPPQSAASLGDTAQCWKAILLSSCLCPSQASLHLFSAIHGQERHSGCGNSGPWGCEGFSLTPNSFWGLHLGVPAARPVAESSPRMAGGLLLLLLHLLLCPGEPRLPPWVQQARGIRRTVFRGCFNYLWRQA